MTRRYFRCIPRLRNIEFLRLYRALANARPYKHTIFCHRVLRKDKLDVCARSNPSQRRLHTLPFCVVPLHPGFWCSRFGVILVWNIGESTRES